MIEEIHLYDRGRGGGTVKRKRDGIIQDRQAFNYRAVMVIVFETGGGLCV